MEVVKKDDINIDVMVALLQEGKTVVYPTETCYGLGCDATNVEAVERIYAIKQRQRNKPLLVVAADAGMLAEFVEWTPSMSAIADRYWPGPLTVVTPTKRGIVLPAGVVAEDGTMAFRITDHHIAEALSRGIGKPLVSTSANISSKKSPYDIGTVLQMFKGNEFEPDIIIDAGVLPHRSPSTIVRVIGEHVEVLRQGELVIG